MPRIEVFRSLGKVARSLGLDLSSRTHIHYSGGPGGSESVIDDPLEELRKKKAKKLTYK